MLGHKQCCFGKMVCRYSNSVHILETVSYFGVVSQMRPKQPHFQYNVPNQTDEGKMLKGSTVC